MILVPVGDDNPRERTPYVNYALLAANLFVFVAVGGDPDGSILASWALVPADFGWRQAFTCMFLHANLFHLAGNLVFLWIFGDNVEDRLGHALYALLYLAWGFIATLLHVATTAHPDLPILGASGAISGVVGAYVVFFPRHPIRLFFWFFLYARIILVPAVWWIGFWFLQQLILAGVDSSGGVAYAAHIGGFIAGAAVAGLGRLLDRSNPAPRSGRGRFPGRVLRTGSRGLGAEIWNPAGLGIDSNDWAVLLTGELPTIDRRLVAAIASTTGEQPDDVLHRLRTTRGVLGRNLDYPTSEALHAILRRLGVTSAIVEDRAANRPPHAHAASVVSWNGQGLGIGIDGAAHQAGWHEPYLYVASAVAGDPRIDILHARLGRVRIGAETGLLDATRHPAWPGTRDGLAQAILRHQSAGAVNEGVRVLAHGGRWGWLDFPSEAEYEDYLFWLHNLARSRAGLAA